MMGGISSSLWSNVILFIIFQIIWTLHSVNISKNYLFYFLIVIIPSSVISILEGIFVRHDGSTAVFLTYFIIRTISVIANIILMILIFYQLSKLNSLSNTSENSQKFHSINPIYLLSMRLIYYCLIQTISRIGASWYQLQYGYGHNYHHETASTIQTVAYLLEYILTPSAGIGYLIVFLMIQPEAKVLCWRLLCSPCSIQIIHREDYLITSSHEDMTVGLTVGDGDADGVTKGYDPDNGDNDDDYDRRLHSNRLPILPSLSSASTPYMTHTYSSHSSSSLFPILDLDEDDLAREIDRLYYQHHHHHHHTIPTNKITK